MTKVKSIQKKIALFVAALLATLSLTVAPAFAQPNIQDKLEQGTCLSTDQDCTDVVGDPNESVNNIITQVVNIFSLVVGVIAVIMIIVGGLKYITSGGDSGNVSGAKNTILYAVIGLVIVALAQIIVRYVLNNATSSQG